MPDKKVKVTIYFDKVTKGGLFLFKSKRTSETIVNVYYTKETLGKAPAEGDQREVEV